MKSERSKSWQAKGLVIRNRCSDLKMVSKLVIGKLRGNPQVFFTGSDYAQHGFVIQVPRIRKSVGNPKIADRFTSTLLSRLVGCYLATASAAATTTARTAVAAAGPALAATGPAAAGFAR